MCSCGDFILPRYGTEAGTPDEHLAAVIASDGEVYGHHHRFKDHFLRDLLYVRAPAQQIEVVSIEHFLALEPSRQPVKILEQSSWGCGHGLLRWNGDCPCTPGDGRWKRGLREAFDELAVRVDALTESVSQMSYRSIPGRYETTTST